MNKPFNTKCFYAEFSKYNGCIGLFIWFKNKSKWIIGIDLSSIPFFHFALNPFVLQIAFFGLTLGREGEYEDNSKIIFSNVIPRSLW